MATKAASELLERAAKLDSHFVEDLVKYYSKHGRFNKDLKWPELMKNFQNRTDEDLHDTADTENVSHEIDSGVDNSSTTNKKSKSKKKDKSKDKKSKGGSTKTVKIVEEPEASSKPTVISEITELPGN